LQRKASNDIFKFPSLEGVRWDERIGRGGFSRQAVNEANTPLAPLKRGNNFSLVNYPQFNIFAIYTKVMVLHLIEPLVKADDACPISY